MSIHIQPVHGSVILTSKYANDEMRLGLPKGIAEPDTFYEFSVFAGNIRLKECQDDPTKPNIRKVRQYGDYNTLYIIFPKDMVRRGDHYLCVKYKKEIWLIKVDMFIGFVPSSLPYPIMQEIVVDRKERWR